MSCGDDRNARIIRRKSLGRKEKERKKKEYHAGEETSKYAPAPMPLLMEQLGGVSLIQGLGEREGQECL
jgi:hypothetical protein